MRDRGIRIGGLGDPVAQNIRNEQNADAMPSPDEVARAKRQHQVEHAQYKAAVAFLHHYEEPTGRFRVRAAAEFLGFKALASTLRGRLVDYGAFKYEHHEPHERGEHSDPRYGPPTVVDDEIRELKRGTFTTVQEAIDRVADIRSARRRLAPFGSSVATAMIIELTTARHVDAHQERVVYTNATWEKAMHAGNWSDRYTPERIREYQDELGERFMIAMEDRSCD
ncbi:hypothetical protein HUG10_20595 (plasmid) [Halorarum halophilum]|uniref:Uncharacterized protein n=1 Tax=Halorarum halophilum TaxID=2743090 RepID=A0A7D5GHN3_9EURY|nr:hypothetical protein [Halobaculum halophilum]QLG30008.1 hypothetical protein HUG10_20595 [Halobaculum halophilum]